MNEILMTAGQVAGIAGIAVGAGLFVFRDIIRKVVLRNLPPELSYRLMRLIIGAAWSIAIVGIVVGYAPKTLGIQIGTANSQQNVGGNK